MSNVHFPFAAFLSYSCACHSFETNAKVKAYTVDIQTHANLPCDGE